MSTNSNRKMGRYLLLGALAALTLTALLTGCAKAGSTAGGQPSAQTAAQQPAAVKDADIVIPISGVSETATFYPAEVGGTKLEVLAVKAPDGSIRTAFNTCQVCYDSGRGYYKQEGNVLVCQNCGNRFSMDKVEVAKGGCNPVPIFSDNKKVDDTNITISYDFLKQAKDIFANWKTGA